MKIYIKNLKLQTFITAMFVVLFVFSALMAILLVNHNMKRASLAEAENKVNIISDAALSIHTYYSHSLKPVLFKDFESAIKKDYFRPEWMSSTYAVSEILKNFKSISDFDYYYKECAVNARSPENEADEFEKKFIEGLNSKTGAERVSAIRDYNGKPFLVSLKKGETMERDCLRCHTKPELAPGGLVEKYGNTRSFSRAENEVVSAISVRIPLNEAYQNADSFSYLFSIFLTGILLLLLLFLLWLNEKLIFSPLKLLRNKTEVIAFNHVNLNEMIEEPFGREFISLTASFNKMASTINDHLINLEEKVDQRTLQLKEFSENLQIEVNDRKKAEEDLKKILGEKEILLKEVHHRVKNNFNIISGLISLKTSGLDSNSKKIFTEVDQALKSMSKIHEFFYKSEKITNINLGEYFNIISDEMVSSFNLSGRIIIIKKEINDVPVNLNQAITCGLLVNEIITNSIKYAFPPDWEGEPEIAVSLRKDNDFIEISVSDNGCGIPDKINIKSSDTLGLTLINMFPSQLNGTITADLNNGTHYVIRFPVAV